MVSINNQSSKRQMVNRKTINIPCTSLTASVTESVKDEELMPPPSSVLKQEFAIQCENLNSSVNSKYTNFL